LVYSLAKYIGIPSLAIEPPLPTIDNGFLIFKDDKVIGAVKNWEEWIRIQQPDLTKEKIAIMIYESNAKEGLLNIEKEIYKNIEGKGFQPIFIFGYPPSKAIKSTILDTISLKNKGIRVAISWFYKFPDSDVEKTLPLLDIPLINAIDIYGYPIDEWQTNRKGLSSTEIAWQIAIPELAGLIQPTVVGGAYLKDGIPYKKAVASRIDRVVDRAIKLVNLQTKPNQNKKIAILYWNYPPGKDNLGASYLDIFKSFPVILEEFGINGYNIGNYSSKLSETLQKQIKDGGRNIGKYAPGSLKDLGNQGRAVLVPIEIYREWFESLNANYRSQIIEHWGKPEESDIMTISKAGKKHIVLPMVKYGNIIFMPQADRARTQDLAALYHSQSLPPHHQYVCQYLWLQKNV
ncbi:MAG TPA: cobaltochelatase subunit CobN, partial [Saprospiraceae bacterium]|nr:cobaltochelatase subunit CobN [Saprospiraceae bacterium]